MRKGAAKLSPREELGRLYLDNPEIVFEVIIDDPKLLATVLERVAKRGKKKS